MSDVGLTCSPVRCVGLTEMLLFCNVSKEQGDLYFGNSICLVLQDKEQ